MKSLIFDRKGFTLVELLVVMVIMVTVGMLIANLFLANLRTAAKTKALTEIKQNGDYALAVMRRMIRNAQKVQSNCPEGGASGADLTILNLDENTTEFTCQSDKIASEGAALTSRNLTVEGCSSAFFCRKPLGRPAVVSISFTLKKGGPSLGKEFTAEIPFQLTVSTRNY